MTKSISGPALTFFADLLSIIGSLSSISTNVVGVSPNVIFKIRGHSGFNTESGLIQTSRGARL